MEFFYKNVLISNLIYLIPTKVHGREREFQNKKNQCIFTVAYGEIDFKLIDDRKKSKTFGNENNIRLNKKKHSILIIPPGVWFSFTTYKKKSILVNLINSVHSDNEILKSNKIKNHLIK